VDLERDGLRLHTGEVGHHDRARRLAGVVDVDARAEAARRCKAAALEHIAEQLVDLAAHALEVGKQVALSGHSPREVTGLQMV
jgi:hypothetical protein